MKNVIIFVLSPFGKDDREPNEFTDSTGYFHTQTRQTNESCIKYLSWKLSKTNEAIDQAFVFITPNFLENGVYNKFKQLFPDIPFAHVSLPEGTVQEAMKTIPKMHDKLLAYQKEQGDEVRISVDITGGFRHASMMMLPLTQLLRYSGFLIGDILYANMSINPKVIEDASDLLDFTSLIGGAAEFVSWGNVKQIQSYFEGAAPPLRVQNLLDKMAALSETLSVCGSYEATEEALSGLDNAISIYEESQKKDKNIDAQELLFSKLIPRIKYEYREILPGENPTLTPIGIIRWCLHKGLLQQAVTFYTEWLPRFLVESKRIYVKNSSIMTECKKNGQLWSHWSIYLLRNYQPNFSGQVNLGENVTLSYGNLVPLFQTGDLKKVLAVVKNCNPEFEDFLHHIQDFCQNCNKDYPVHEILSLPHDDLIYKLMEWTAPLTASLDSYVYKRVSKERNIEGVIVKAMGMLPKDKVKYFFGNSNDADDEKETTNKPQWRKEVFQYLLENKLITTSLKKENLLNFIERYEMFVDELRNKFAHATADSGTIEGKDDIIDAIEESLEFITHK